MSFLKSNNGNPFVEIGNEVDDITEYVRCEYTEDFFGWMDSYTSRLNDFFAGGGTVKDSTPKL